MRRFELQEADNGGWIVTSDHRHDRMLVGPFAAYSNTDEMLKGLAETLHPPKKSATADEIEAYKRLRAGG